MINDNNINLEDNNNQHHPEVPKPKKHIGREIWTFVSDVLLNAVIILLIVGITRAFIISPFQVAGNSMERNLHDSDYIVVDKISYRLKEPERGDIIVLIPPESTESFFVKRIIGLPGEKIEFRDGEIIIHNDAFPAGLRLEEDYLSPENKSTYLPHKENNIIEISNDHYFVMGDNRSASNDSRLWGSLHRRNIEGRAWVVVWPWDNFEVKDRPEYLVDLVQE